MSFLDISTKVMLGEKLQQIPLRVCYYARVSTDSDKQFNSLENQSLYYEKYIKSQPYWTYVDGYIDYGISGVRVDKRVAFKKMIYDGQKGKFDLIITKEVSRFARDLEDSIHYIRLLKEANVGVFFENQNINTFDSNSELILNIMFNLAQDESKKLSSRIKFGHWQAIERGHVLGSSNIMGYQKDHCRLIIVEEEAQFVRMVFQLYATGNYGLTKLAKKLGSLGYYNKNGNYYDKDSLKRIIENPKYKGYYRGKTTEVVDYRTKKRKKIMKDRQVCYKCLDDSIPAIVSEELWERANQVLCSRNCSKGSNNSFTGLKYAFSSKIICGVHHTSFQRSHGARGKKRPTWSCSKYLQYRLDACESPIIAESDLFFIMKSIFQSLFHDYNAIVQEMMKIYQEVESVSLHDLETISDRINKIEKKKAYALDTVVDGIVSKDVFIKQIELFEKQIQALEGEKDAFLKQNKRQNTELLIYSIEKELLNDSIDDFIRQFLDKIVVLKRNNNRREIQLDIYLKCSVDLLLENQLSSCEKNGKNYFYYKVFYTKENNMISYCF